MFRNQTVSVIIPARNEAGSLSSVIEKVPSWVDEIIVIDGNSRDQTRNISENHNRVSKTLVQKSRGKGAALSAGFSAATMDIVAIIDADGSMDPSELEFFVAKFPNCDIVKGSRYLKGGGSSDLTFIRSIGNQSLTKLANFLFKQSWTDMAYGFAVFDQKVLQSLALTNYDLLGSLFGHKSYGQGFEIETLMFTRAARRGLRIIEVPSFEHDRVSGSSNLRAIRDGIRVLISIIVERSRDVPFGKGN